MVLLLKAIQVGKSDSVQFSDVRQGFSGADGVCARCARQYGIGRPGPCAWQFGRACAGNQQDLADGDIVLVSQAVNADQLVQGDIEAERNRQ